MRNAKRETRNEINERLYVARGTSHAARKCIISMLILVILVSGCATTHQFGAHEYRESETKEDESAKGLIVGSIIGGLIGALISGATSVTDPKDTKFEDVDAFGQVILWLERGFVTGLISGDILEFLKALAFISLGAGVGGLSGKMICSENGFAPEKQNKHKNVDQLFLEYKKLDWGNSYEKE